MFQSTHSLRSATLPDGCKSHLLAVSIHALLAECDYKPSRSRNHVHRFNPRTPCGVRRPPPSRQSDCLTFQSTHSLRSATHRMRAFRERHPVSIHALLAECDFRKYPVRRADLVVSIHALLAECDGHGLGIRVQLHRFQSTHSLRSATSSVSHTSSFTDVSIHALLAECDIRQKGGAGPRRGFNPRTPCGVRRHDCIGRKRPGIRFNPRTPCGVRLRAEK